MRCVFFAILVCLLYSCANETKDRLQGHWVCVKNCDEIKTLDFYKDSIEINAFMKYLRLKKNSFYKFHSKNDTLFCENTFYDEKRRTDFYFDLEGNILIFGDKESVFERKNSSVFDDYKNYFPLQNSDIEVPALNEFISYPPKYLDFSPEVVFIKYDKGVPCFYEKGSCFPINRLPALLHERLSNFSEEERAIRDFYFCIDRRMKMKDVDSVFKIMKEGGYYRTKLLYYGSKFKTGVPEKYLTYHIPPFNDSQAYSDYQISLYDGLKIKQRQIKEYFSNANDKIRLKIQIRNNKLFFNGELCKNSEEVLEKYQSLFSYEKNPELFFKIDSVFITEYRNLLKNNHSDEFGLIDNHEKDFETMESILQTVPSFHTLKYFQFGSIEVHSSTAYEDWLEVYVGLMGIHEKMRYEVCKKLFHKNYYSLKEHRAEDLEIIRMVRTILPFKIIPLRISE